MGQLGFYDLNKRLDSISAKGDPLKAVNSVVSFESFRAEIEAVVRLAPEERKSNTGRCGDIRLYDFASGHLVALLTGHTNVLLSLAFSPDGQQIISGSFDHTAIIWNVEARRVSAAQVGITR